MICFWNNSDFAYIIERQINCYNQAFEYTKKGTI